MKMIARQAAFRSTQAVSLALLFTLSLIATAYGQSGQTDQAQTIKIKNFGKLDERFYRGAQPKESDFKDLAALGIKLSLTCATTRPVMKKPPLKLPECNTSTSG